MELSLSLSSEMTLEEKENSPFSLYVSVVLDLALPGYLDYGIPREWEEPIQEGMRLLVPLKNRPTKATVVSLKNNCSYPKVLPALQILKQEKTLSPTLFRLALWMSSYYGAPLGQVIRTLLPQNVKGEHAPQKQLYVSCKKSKRELRGAAIKLRPSYPRQAAILDILLTHRGGIFLSELLTRAHCSRSPVESLTKKGYIQITQREQTNSSFDEDSYFRTEPKILNQEQYRAKESIAKAVREGGFSVHLLQGVTGSGKTEVYLQIIQEVLEKREGGTIILVPEIALTLQTVEHFRSRFSLPLAVWHSQLTARERVEIWEKVERGEFRLIIGARSAIFTPLPKIALIIVDEEHESSYKQTETPSYHARHIALMRAQIEECPVLLGSATPSLESRYNCDRKKYTRYLLSSRAQNFSLPQATTISLKEQRGTLFSPLLLEKIRQRHDRGEQVLLFLNRRGYHTSQVCTRCFESVHCPHCSTSLTFHRRAEQLSCHLCGFACFPADKCNFCSHTSSMKYRGVGTEWVEERLKAILPQLRILRVDADTTTQKGSCERMFHQFRSGKADLLIGTQMIAKGLHFPSVTLVAILNGDAQLNIPDFTAAEQSFQLITQVGGRSGRGQLPGEFLIQSYQTENRIIQLASQQDYESFYREELLTRKNFAYPPYTQMIKLLFSHPSLEELRREATEFRKQLIGQLPSQVSIHPLLPSGIAKLQERYRLQFLLRGEAIIPIQKAISETLALSPLSKKIRMQIDVHPLSTFF